MSEKPQEGQVEIKDLQNLKMNDPAKAGNVETVAQLVASAPQTPQTEFIYSSSELGDNHSQTRLKPKNKEEPHNKSESIEQPITEVAKDVSWLTMVSNAFIIAKACLGVTCFSFAVRCKQFGLVWLLIFQFVCCLLTIWTSIRLIQASRGIKEKDYSLIVAKIMGDKAKDVLDFIILVTCIAYNMAFMSMIYSLIGRFIQSTFQFETYETYDDYLREVWGKAAFKYGIIFGAAFCSYFLSLMRDLSKLSFAGVVGTVATFYPLLVVIVQTHKYNAYFRDNVYKEEDPSTHANYFDLGKSFGADLQFVKGIATLFLSYSAHASLFPIYESYHTAKNAEVNMDKTIALGEFIVCLIQVVSSVCSFLTEPIHPEDVILYRINRFGGRDLWMGVGKITLSISIFLTIPMFVIIPKTIIADLFFGGTLSNKVNYIYTGLSLGLCALVACVYDNILNYINYIGGFCIVFQAILFPILAYVKSNGLGMKHWKNVLELGAALVLVLLGIVAGILTIVDDIKG